MAKEIQSIDRQVSTPNVQVRPNQAYATLGEATSQLGNLITNKLEDQVVHYAGIAGEQHALEGTARKDLLPPLTKATAAYNTAVANTEARQLATQGREMILQTYAELSNPATFNENTPAVFNAKLTGITQGILDNTRPENRAAVQLQMNELAATAKVKMLDEAIQYDNKQTQIHFERDLEGLQEQLNEAILTKNKALESAIRDNIASVLNDYGTINQPIKNKLPDIIKKINDAAIISTELGNYLEAQDQGEGDRYIAKFAQNEQPQLTQEQKYTSLSKMISVNNQVERAVSETRATAKQILFNDIDNPASPTHITSIEQLQSRPAYDALTPLQQEQTISHFINSQKAAINKQAKFAEAFKEISLGRAGAVEKSTINDIFYDTRAAQEEALGRPLSLAEQFGIVQQLQTNVPDFDKLMNSKFTSMDVQATKEAAQLYSTLRLSDQTNLLNLTGDAAIVAEKMATLLNGTSNPQDDSVNQVMNTVLKKNDPIIAERNAKATKLWEAKGPAMYKSVFGVGPDPFSDNGAYRVFQEQFFAAYANGATEDEAARIARDGMREWGDDPFFEPGTIGQFPPNKELPLSYDTQSIRNQIIVGLDSIIKANNEGKTPAKGEQPIKFVGDVNIPEKMSQEDFTYTALDGFDKHALSKDLMNSGLNLAAIPASIAESFSNAPPVMVEVNGVKSEVTLVSSPQTKASGTGLVYGVFAKDKFGIYQQLKDPRNDDGLAYVVLRDLDKIAPELFEGQGNERLMKTFEKARDNQLKQAVKDELFRSTVGEGMFGKGARKVIETFPVSRLLLEGSLAAGVAIADKGELTIDELRRQLEVNKPDEK